MESCNFVFFAKKTKSKFYLPLYKTDFIQKFIFEHNTYYENKILEVVKKWNNYNIFTEIKNGTVLDIGANIGNHALFFANECEAKQIYCFEPIPKTFEILKKNIEINNLNDKIHLNNVAIGEKEGKASIEYFYDTNLGGTSIKADSHGNIQTISIDNFSFSTNDHIKLMKIDVEGFEHYVIKGCLKTIAKYRPFIFIEVREQNKKNIDSMIIPLGYSLTILEKNQDYSNLLYHPN